MKLIFEQAAKSLQRESHEIVFSSLNQRADGRDRQPHPQHRVEWFRLSQQQWIHLVEQFVATREYDAKQPFLVVQRDRK